MEFIVSSMKNAIGNYQILRSLGKGGMGEVFLAHDPICERDVALKKIRDDWLHSKVMQERFLREARIASQLTHPSIIPIYTIQQEQEITFYTMPYIEGETLKSILATARQQEKKGEILHPIGSSIPALIRIFLNVCSAIAYTHSKGILHRDLKPENIIVGKYGEVIILDWGLADYIGNPEMTSTEGKATIPGTIAYMAPERAFGESSSIHSDIYSLGVILYQILTLKLPFQRTTLKDFRHFFKYEKLVDPEELAPDRDISPQLSDIVKKCLAPVKEERVQNVQELISDLEKYIEGLPEWILSTTLHINNKSDWEFQENILLAKHMAISRSPDNMEWVNFMISKAFFIENVMLDTHLQLGKSGSGIGFLIGRTLEDGYYLWIGSSEHPGAKLYRCNVEVVSHPEIFLKESKKHHLRIEKLGNLLRFYLDGVLQFGYLSHLPTLGKQIGLICRDEDFQMEGVNVFVGSQNVTVNCLSIPDAFLARKNYSQAFTEYQRIAHSFPGRKEGREATFRAGITLLEEAESKKKKKEKEVLYTKALEEFEKLHGTPGAPLEYLGKSLVYKASNEIIEEVKCLELALRRFPKHPLRPFLVENLLSRLHESARTNRKAAFHFALLALRYLPHIFSHPDHQTLLDSLKKHLEPLYFIQPTSHPFVDMAIELSFWLDKPLTIADLFEKNPDEASNCLYPLLQLRYFHLFQEKLEKVVDEKVHDELEFAFNCLQMPLKKAVANALEASHEPRSLMLLIERGIEELQLEPLEPLFNTHQLKYQIWSHLLSNEFNKAAKLFKKIPSHLLKKDTTDLFFLYGCFLVATKGEKKGMEYLTDIMVTSYPPLAQLLSHYLLGRISLTKGWIKEAFYFEKLQLFKQLELFYHCAKKRKLKLFFSKKIRRLRAKRSSEIL